MAENAGISEEQVRSQLDKIQKDQSFGRSKRACDLLTYLVTEALEGRSDLIKAFPIAVEVFGRDEGFDPDTDSLVRVQVGRLRKALDEYYSGPGGNDGIRIYLPIGSYVPIFEHHKCVASVGDRLIDDRPRLIVDATSVLTGEDKSQRVGERIFLNLVHNLTRFKGLVIISDGSDDTVRDARENTYVLRTTVTQSEAVLRLVAQVVASEGRVVWSEIFEPAAETSKAVGQFADVSNRLTSAVASPYGVISRQEKARRKAPTDNAGDLGQFGIYDAVLAFEDYLAERTAEAHAENMARLERIIDVDPDYARAWAMLSWYQGDELRQGFAATATEPPIERSQASAKRGVELDPTDSMTQLYLCSSFVLGQNMELAREGLDHALELNPNNTDVIAMHALLLAHASDWKAAQREAQRAIALSPAHPSWYGVVPYMLAFRDGEYERAIAMIELRPDVASPLVYVGRMAAYLKLSQRAEAEQYAARLAAEFPDFLPNIDFMFRIRGFPEDFIAIMLEALQEFD